MFSLTLVDVKLVPLHLLTSPDAGGQRLVIDVSDTGESHHWGQGCGEHVAGDCTRVHRVCGVEVDQRGVAGRGRGAAANRHQV